MQAQTRALVGDGDTMRERIRAHREALEATTQAALAILGTRSNDGFRNEIVATLRTASTDDEVGRVLQRGRLVREVDASAGFPQATGLAVTALRRRDDRPHRTAEKSSAPKQDASAEVSVAADAEREAQRELQLAQAERRAGSRRGRHQAQPDARVEKLEQDLAAARRRLEDARAREEPGERRAHRAAGSLTTPATTESANSR